MYEIYLVKDGNRYNRPPKELVIDTDQVVLISDINNHLPNNTLRFNKDIGIIPSGSNVQLQTDTSLIIAIFNENKGILDDITNRLSGEWNVISELKYL